MNILIDFTQLPIQKVGVGVYGLNLVLNLKFDESTVYYILIQDDDDSLNTLESEFIVLLRVNAKRFRKLIHRVYLEQIYIPYLVYKYKIDVVHSLHYSFPIMHRAKKVVTLCDMIFFKYPELHLKRKVFYFRFFIWLSTIMADKVICISRSTESDYVKHFNSSSSLTTVIQLGKDDSYRPNLNEKVILSILQKYKIDKDYILFVGTIEPRKNIRNIILAFEKLVRFGCPLNLVLVGKKGWHYESTFSLVTELSLNERIIFTGFVDEVEKPYLLAGAEMFVYPSIYEGFGIPVLEALACGTPTITSNISSMPEVAGNAAILVDPLNVSDIYSAMLSIYENKALGLFLRNAGLLQADIFSWRKTADQTVLTYKSL